MSRSTLLCCLMTSVAIAGSNQASAQEPTPSGLNFEQFDKDGSGTIEPGEMPAVRGPVRTILEGRDSNADGRVDRSEFYGLPQNRMPSLAVIGAGQQRSVFDLLDSNGDGKVIRAEAQRPGIPAAMRSLAERSFKASGKDEFTLEDLEKAVATNVEKPGTPPTFFTWLDANKDGAVSREEINEAAKNPSALQLSGLDTKSLFEALSKSDQASFTEPQMTVFLIPVFMRDTFKQLDTNGDGITSVEEAPQRLRGPLEGLLSRSQLPLSTRLSLEDFEALYKPTAPRPAPTSQKHNQIPAAFQALDANHDGFIEPGELVDVVLTLGRLDVNGDDRLSVEEFVGTLPGSRQVPPTPNIGDERLPEPEAKPAPTPAANSTDQFIAKFFGKYDNDGNNKLTDTEVPPQAFAKIQSLDIDGDGAVSRAEFAEGLAARQ